MFFFRFYFVSPKYNGVNVLNAIQLIQILELSLFFNSDSSVNQFNLVLDALTEKTYHMWNSFGASCCYIYESVQCLYTLSKTKKKNIFNILKQRDTTRHQQYITYVKCMIQNLKKNVANSQNILRPDRLLWKHFMYVCSLFIVKNIYYITM